MPKQQELTEIIPDLVYVKDEIKNAVYDGLKHSMGFSQPFFIDGQGKKLRPALFLASAKIHWDDVKELIPLATSLELIHLATLTHDDIVDSATMRRNLPTVNASKGNKVAVLLGDYFFAKAFSLLTSVGNTEIINLFARVVEQMSLGEIQQQIAAFNLYLTEEEYLQQIKQKTALFMASCCLAGCLTFEASEDMKTSIYNFGLNLGMAFQITDDVIDFKGTKSNTGKNSYSDLKNGVITLPLIHVLKSTNNTNLLLKWMKQENPKDDGIGVLLENMNIDEGIDYALTVARKFIDRARYYAERVPSKEVLETFHAISYMILSRAE